MKSHSTPIIWPNWLSSKAEVGAFDPSRLSSKEVIAVSKEQKKKIIFLYDPTRAAFSLPALIEVMNNSLFEQLHKDFEIYSYSDQDGLKGISSLTGILTVNNEFSHQSMWKTICINGKTQKDFITIGLSQSPDDLVRLWRLMMIGATEEINLVELVNFLKVIKPKELYYTVLNIFSHEISKTQAHIAYLMRLMSYPEDIGFHLERKLKFLPDGTDCEILINTQMYDALEKLRDHVGHDKFDGQMRAQKEEKEWSPAKYFHAIIAANPRLSIKDALIIVYPKLEIIQGDLNSTLLNAVFSMTQNWFEVYESPEMFSNDFKARQGFLKSLKLNQKFPNDIVMLALSLFQNILLSLVKPGITLNFSTYKEVILEIMVANTAFITAARKQKNYLERPCDFEKAFEEELEKHQDQAVKEVATPIGATDSFTNRSSVIYYGTTLSHQVSRSNGSNTITQAPLFDYLTSGSPPSWINSLVRMTPGAIFQLNADTEKFSEISPKRIKVIQPSESSSPGQHRLKIFTSQLVSMKIGEYYLLPLYHSELILAKCIGGSVFEDQFGRWFLTTHDLSQCEIELSLPYTTNADALAHVIDVDTYHDHQELLKSLDVWDTINNYFKPSSHAEDANAIEAFSSSNNDNISCNDRSQYLVRKFSVTKNVKFVTNGSHAFLLMTNPKTSKPLLIDCGGARVEITLEAMQEEFSKSPSLYQKQLSYVANTLNKKLSEAANNEEKTEKLSASDYLGNGAFCVIGDPLETAKTINSWGQGSACQYFPDASTFIRQAEQSLTTNAIFMINLDPWHTEDHSKREQLRLCLHEWLDKYRGSHTFILLTEHEFELKQDASFSSRVTKFYYQPECMPLEVVRNLSLTTHPSLMSLDITLILKEIYSQSEKGITTIAVPIAYSDEDRISWERLATIINSIQSTQYIYVYGQYHKLKNQVSIALQKCAINLDKLFADTVVTSSGDSKDTLIVTPDLLSFGLVDYMNSIADGSTITLFICQQLSMQQWFVLLNTASINQCHLVLTAADLSVIPYERHIKNTTINLGTKVLVSNAPRVTASRLLTGRNNTMLISAAELNGPDSLVSAGDHAEFNVFHMLQSGKNVILYANQALDMFGNLQQLLLPFFMGYTIDQGKRHLLSGNLTLVISSEDKCSIDYLSQLNLSVTKVLENFNGNLEQESEEAHPDEQGSQTISERELPLAFQSLPDLNAMRGDYLLPELCSPERRETIHSLWKHFGTREKGSDKVHGILIEGPSALGKTALIKQLFSHLGFFVFEGSSENYCQTKRGNVCYFYKHTGRESLQECIAHSKKYNHVMVIDEINGLSIKEQEIVADVLSNQKGGKKKLFLVGTYNPPYYPGREVCIAQLKKQCAQYSFKPYSPSESVSLFKLTLQLKYKLPLPMLDDLMNNIIITEGECDALLRIISSCFESSSAELMELAFLWTDEIFESAVTNFVVHYLQIVKNYNGLLPCSISASSKQLLSDIAFMSERPENKLSIAARLVNRSRATFFLPGISKSQEAVSQNIELSSLLGFFSDQAKEQHGKVPSKEQLNEVINSVINRKK